MRVILVFLHHPVKSTHDLRVLPQRRPVLANRARSEAGDHGFDQRLFETACRLGLGNDRWSSSARCPAAACNQLLLQPVRCFGIDERLWMNGGHPSGGGVEIALILAGRVRRSPTLYERRDGARRSGQRAAIMDELLDR
jgi:hypothetical protein